MYLLPLEACVLSSVFTGTMVARYLGQRGSSLLSLVSLAVAFGASLLIWVEVCLLCCEVWIDLWGAWSPTS